MDKCNCNPPRSLKSFICISCGNESQSCRNGRKFCSPQCRIGIFSPRYKHGKSRDWKFRYANKKQRKENCEECGKIFFHKQSEPQKSRFCGYSCSGKYRSRLPSFALREKNEKWRRNHINVMPKGNKHWNWQGGKSSFQHLMRGTTEWKEWREKVFERDGYKCIDCGKGGRLEPHHILPIREKKYRNKLFILTNGITICRPCHQKTFGKEEQLAMTYFALVGNQIS